MPSRIQKELELLLTVNSTKFRKDLNDLLRGVKQLKTSLAGVNLNFGGSSTTSGLSSANKQLKAFNNNIVQTANSMRVFGNNTGLMKIFAIIRSELLLLAFAFAGIVRSINNSIEAFRQYQANLTALRSISEKTVGDFNSVKQAAIDLTNKGFISLSESSKALQNLLATGFNLEQSVNILKTFGDFAAYNRQATYEWGEAVVVATEGVRLGLSTLSDAAGMTRNLGQLLEANGVSQKKLSELQSDATARQALYNGIIKEGTLVLGNAEKAMSEYTGIVAQSNLVIQKLKIAFGELISPIFTDFYKGLTTITQGWVDYININKDIIKLDIKNVFGDISGTLKETISVVGPLIRSLVGIASEFKAIIIFLVTIKGTMALVSIVTKLFKQYLEGAAKAANMLSKGLTAASMSAGVWGKIIAVVVAGAIFLWEKYQEAQEKVFRNEERRVAQSMQVLRFEDAYLQKVREITNRELENVKAKIKLQGETKELTNEQNKLKKELEEIDKQIATTNFNLDKFQLIMDSISLDRLRDQIKGLKEDFRWFSTESGLSKTMDSILGPIVKGAWAFLTQSSPKKIKAFDSMSFPDVAKIQDMQSLLLGINKGDNNSWKQAEKDIRDLLNTYTQAFSKLQQDNLKKGLLLPDEVTNSWKEAIGALNKLLGFAGKNTEALLIDNKNKTKELTDDQKRFLNDLRNLQQQTEEALIPGDTYARVTEKALNVIEDYRAKAKDIGMEITADMEKIFSAFVSAKQIEYSNKQIKEFFDGQNKLQEERLKESTRLRKEAYEAQLSVSKEFYTKLDELIISNEESRMSDFDKERTRLELLRQEFIALTTILPALSSAMDTVNKAIDQAIGDAKSRMIYEASRMWDEMARGIGETWLETQYDIRQTEEETINQLRRELQRGAIDQEEYALRVANAHDVAATQAYNAWRNAGRGILSVMSQYMTQVMADAFKKTKSISAALNETFSLSSLGMGLATAGISIGIGLLANELFKTKPTPTYEDISPDTTSAETRRKMGSISAASPQYIMITPTVSIEGNTNVWIADGSVESFATQMEDLILNMTQKAIDSQALDLSGVSPK